MAMGGGRKAAVVRDCLGIMLARAAYAKLWPLARIKASNT
jgi:hypothetical protein